MRTEHDIFNKPIKIELTIEEQPTPASYARYAEGRDLGESMPMWRVQTEGYLSHPGQLIGIVSRNAGFLDSPDVEWISGGVNSKGPMAVALGRHGNFFHWGFAASPTYMTDEAKDVFFNAIHHIAKFDGQTPIARKLSGVMIRTAVDDAIKSMSEEGYARTVKTYDEFRVEDEKRRVEIQKRIDDDEEVSDLDKQILKMPPIKTPDRIDQTRRLVSAESLKELDEDPDKLTAYLQKVKPYFRPDGWYQLTVDEELMQLGIPNHDMAMLDKAIELLDSKDDAELGQNLLTRYTDEFFETRDQWADWLRTNRDKLFFTEAGGYKWLVNERSKPQQTVARAKATAQSPFAASMSIEPDGENEYVLTVSVDILDGWHAYDIVPGNSPYAPVKLNLELPTGLQKIGEWKRPLSNPSIDNPATTTFVGNLTFSCRLGVEKLDTAANVTCTISYQVCDDEKCLPPTTVEHVATIKPSTKKRLP